MKIIAGGWKLGRDGWRWMRMEGEGVGVGWKVGEGGWR